MWEQSIVENYYRLAPKKRLDVIVLHYDGLKYYHEPSKMEALSHSSINISMQE